MERYVENEKYDDNLSPECLVTAAATHDSVSCSPEAGGNGLTDFLHAFTDVAASNDHERKSFVISGCGHVHFFGHYGKPDFTPDNRIRQTFNVQNSIYYPPDSNHVFHVNGHFPGTIIGVRFYLSREGLEQKVNGETCLLYTSPSPRDRQKSRMPSSA